MMAGLKRAATTSTRLSTRPSAVHASVTLYTLAGPSESPADTTGDSPRRSKRVKRSNTNVTGDDGPVDDSASPSVAIVEKKTRTTTSKKRASAASTPAGSPSPTKKAKPIQQILEKPHPEPENWRRAYDLIMEMRYTEGGVASNAAVDTMGCDMAQRNEGNAKV
jgi:endonuclease III